MLRSFTILDMASTRHSFELEICPWAKATSRQSPVSNHVPWKYACKQEYIEVDAVEHHTW